MLSAAGSTQVAVTAIGFTTLFFIIIAMAAAMALGYGRKSDGPRAPSGRGERGRGQEQFRGGQRARGPQRSYDEQPARGGFQPGGKFGVSHRRDMLQVEVNPNKCARFGFCEHEAPEVFYLESDGRFGYQAVVSVDKMEEVITAMDVCPRRAIKVKIPEGYNALDKPVEDLPPANDNRRTVIPIMGERLPEDERPRRDRLPEDERPRPRRA